MTKVRKIDIELNKRVETGPLQFGDDWPGVFIRGDNATYYAMMLHQYLSGGDDVFCKMALQKLYETLNSCRVK